MCYDFALSRCDRKGQIFFASPCCHTCGLPPETWRRRRRSPEEERSPSLDRYRRRQALHRPHSSQPTEKWLILYILPCLHTRRANERILISYHNLLHKVVGIYIKNLITCIGMSVVKPRFIRVRTVIAQLQYRYRQGCNRTAAIPHHGYMYQEMVLPERLELSTSPLPRECTMITSYGTTRQNMHIYRYIPAT